MSKLRQFIILLKIIVHFECDDSNTSDNSGEGQQKAAKVNDTKKKQLEAHFINNWVRILRKK